MILYYNDNLFLFYINVICPVNTDILLMQSEMQWYWLQYNGQSIIIILLFNVCNTYYSNDILMTG